MAEVCCSLIPDNRPWMFEPDSIQGVFYAIHHDLVL